MNVNNDYHYLQSKLNKSLSLGYKLILVLFFWPEIALIKVFVHSTFVNPDSKPTDDGMVVLLQMVQIHNLSECILSFSLFK